jgi:hypothetical protein
MVGFFKVLSVIISCALFFGKVGMPAAVILFEFNFWKVILVSNLGGLLGVVTFTYISAGLLKWWNVYKRKNMPQEKTTTFRKSNRRIIKIKNRFGLTGIAILTPFLLSIPIGAFLAERFYKDKRKVITYLSVSVVCWSFVLYGVFYLFYNQLKGWLI